MNAPEGVLHLVPVPLADVAPSNALPAPALAQLAQLDYFIVESEKSARAFLKAAAHPLPLREILIERFDKDSDASSAERLLQPLLQGRSAGVLSEAGCPAVADPGSLLIAAAHRLGLQVVPHVGPSSLLLALMASGFNGQRFMFHGYLPVARDQCRRQIAELEAHSRANDVTQIFIETPYRGDALFDTLLETCAATTRICVASDLTLPSASVISKSTREWKASRRAIGRRPAVFLLYARQSRVP